MSANSMRVHAAGVGKKYSRSLRRSLWYGALDTAHELLGGSVERDALRPTEFWALRDVNFDLRPGECLGLIGPNGAGKTTLLKLLNGLVKPDTGRIVMRGRVGGLIALGAGFNPILTGRENIYVNAAVLGLTRRETDDRLDEIIEFAELGTFIDTPVQNYSSGMQVRLGYAVASRLRPDVLLVDEVLAVGDAGFQRKCQQSMAEYIAAGGSVILVSHDMHAIQSSCHRCAVFDGGRLTFIGNATEGIAAYHGLVHHVSRVAADRREAGTPSEREPVVITGITVTGADGGPIVTGGAARIHLRYRAVRSIPSVAWGFSVWTGDQHRRICSATSSWDAFRGEVRAGDGNFECIIPKLPLVGNAYALRAGIYDAVTSSPLARMGWDDAAARFVVESPATEQHNRRVASDDIVVLDVEWCR